MNEYWIEANEETTDEAKKGAEQSLKIGRVLGGPSKGRFVWRSPGLRAGAGKRGPLAVLRTLAASHHFTITSFSYATRLFPAAVSRSTPFVCPFPAKVADPACRARVLGKQAWQGHGVAFEFP